MLQRSLCWGRRLLPKLLLLLTTNIETNIGTINEVNMKPTMVTPNNDFGCYLRLMPWLVSSLVPLPVSF